MNKLENPFVYLNPQHINMKTPLTIQQQPLRKRLELRFLRKDDQESELRKLVSKSQFRNTPQER